jgi:hypothetical protein
VSNNPLREAVLSEQAQAIFDQAMKLSVADRELLVSQLRCSIDEAELSPDEQAAHDAALAPEIRRGAKESELGPTRSEPWMEVLDGLLDMIPD